MGAISDSSSSARAVRGGAREAVSVAEGCTRKSAAIGAFAAGAAALAHIATVRVASNDSTLHSDADRKDDALSEGLIRTSRESSPAISDYR
jgi:hypothetical protein